MIWRILKKVSIFIGYFILGSIIGFLLSSFWFEGGNTFWKPIDYFPNPVAKIIAMKPLGDEFWVETTDNSIYHAIYPCQEGEACWEKINVVPSLLHRDSEYIVTNNKCDNNDFVYPLFQKIYTCTTSTVLATDAYWKVSLVLTDNNKM